MESVLAKILTLIALAGLLVWNDVREMLFNVILCYVILKPKEQSCIR